MSFLVSDTCFRSMPRVNDGLFGQVHQSLERAHECVPIAAFEVRASYGFAEKRVPREEGLFLLKIEAHRIFLVPGSRDDSIVSVRRLCLRITHHLRFGKVLLHKR